MCGTRGTAVGGGGGGGAAPPPPPKTTPPRGHTTPRNNPFRGSSVVERLAVNELVVGSNPTRGA
jgi:hypothetical protein